MFVPRKLHLFGNKYHTIVCAKYKVIYYVNIVKGKDRPRVMGEKEFEEKGVTDGLVVRMINTLWGTRKVVVVDIGLCVLEVLISMSEKGVLGSDLIKKQRYWPKGVPEDEIHWHIQTKQVGDVDSFKC